jgi:hypothetical protein
LLTLEVTLAKLLVFITYEVGLCYKNSFGILFEKKQDALKKNEALRELERGTLATGTQRKLGEYLVDWLDNVHKGKLRIGTYVNYKKLLPISWLMAKGGHGPRQAT